MPHTKSVMTTMKIQNFIRKALMNFAAFATKTDSFSGFFWIPSRAVAAPTTVRSGATMSAKAVVCFSIARS
jgi:hypothetical protein